MAEDDPTAPSDAPERSGQGPAPAAQPEVPDFQPDAALIEYEERDESGARIQRR